MATERVDPTGVAEGTLPFPLQDGETVLQVCRRHWMYLWPRTALWAVIAVVPPILVFWLLNTVTDVDGTVGMIFAIAAVIWLVVWGIRALFNWYVYTNDIWVITNQRIVDSVKPTPFSMKLSSADLVNIQDMTVERRGILQTSLNYGDIHCQTAADNRDFLLNGVPNPQDLQLLIDRERDRERRGMRG